MGEHPDSWHVANDLASDYAAAVVIARRPSQGGPVNHGSGLIARLDGRYFLLTAAHVITEWARRTAADPNLRMHLVSPTQSAAFEPTDRILHHDEQADIGIVRLTAEEANATGRFVYSIIDWPPPAPEIGELVHVVGFPRVGRIAQSRKKYEFRSFAVSTHVTTVAGTNFKCQFRRDMWESGNQISASESPKQLEGISGGPVMAMRGLRLEFLGSVSEHQVSLDILIASRWSGVSRNVFAAA